MLYNPLYRINSFSMLKLIDITNDTKEFKIVKDEINLDYNQYLIESDINKTVWDSGTFEHRLNKTATALPLHVLSGTEPSFVGDYLDCRLMLQQGYNWTNVFGLHILVKSLTDDSTLFSKIFQITDFVLTGNKELLDGCFWMEEVQFFIPDLLNHNIACQVTEVNWSDVEINDLNTVGFIYNYPNDVIPLIDEKPLPDYINNFLRLDENHFLYFGLKTTENKTVEQSILDSFSLTNASVKVEHIIDYGNSTSGYKTIKITNEDNKYGDLNIGLNLTSFVGENNNIVEIILTTQIWVDSKLMRRVATLNTDMDEILPLITSQITHPDTNFPVTVNIENVINQTVIEQKQTNKILSIYQPVFVEMITEDFYYEKKSISFNHLINQAYLKVIASEGGKEQTILSNITSDGKIYFDLTKLIPITEQTTYQLIDVEKGTINGYGNILVK